MADLVEQLANGDFAVTKPGRDGKPFTHVYAIHPDRLPAPRQTYIDASKEMQQAQESWRKAEKQAEGVRRMIARYFEGNEKYRGKMLELKSPGQGYDVLEIPIDAIFGGDWVQRLLDYGKHCDHEAEKAKWEFVRAVNALMPDYHPDKKPLPPMPEGVDPALYGQL
jgi:hypothetical protein